MPFAEALVKVIEEKGGKVHFNSETVEVKDEKEVTIAIKDQKKTLTFDRVIITLPAFLYMKITPQLPENYKQSLVKLRGLGATNMILRLKKPFLPNNTYWLSICEPNAPIMVLVEHTNFMDKKHYNNEHLLYIGNYPAPDSEKYKMDKEQLLKYYDPFLKKINPDYQKDLIGYQLFKAYFAQPIVPTNYSKMLPSMTTPLKHVYLANIEQVYPWDRGTNYAVELGEKAAQLIKQEK